MKITDLGLKHILSLGLSKETERAGIYYLYTWDDINYYCGLDAYKDKFDQNKGTFISLSAEQLALFGKKKTPKTQQDHKGLDSVLSLYETALVLRYNVETDSFTTDQCDGVLTCLNHLDIGLEEPSPFKIVWDTKKPFHGFYQPLGEFDNALKSLGVETEKIWMTLYPVEENKSITKVILGLSMNQEYGMDSLQVFKDYLAA